MKKIIIYSLIFILLTSGFHSVSSNQSLQNINNQVIIYQISQRSYEPNIDFYSKYDPNNIDGFDYVIITTKDLEDSIINSEFISWKDSLGYSIKIVLLSDELIQDQLGNDLPAKIRNFLREYYDIWGIKYVLIVGDHDTIPMRYCYPDPQNHYFNIYDHFSGEIPTDHYYADLSLPDQESWDSDGDGFYGEFEEDNPDFLAEVIVGRIPTAVQSRITYTLNKIVNFEQDVGLWKYNSLHAGAFWYFENEDNGDSEIYDGSTSLNLIETQIMEGWNVSHYSEQEGLFVSEYDWLALTENSFINDWNSGKYSVVNWGAHGGNNGAARKVWSWDDGDNVPESNEIDWPYFISTTSNLDDDYPSVLFAISCLIGYPEKIGSGNIGIDLLTKPIFGSSIGVLGATRITYGCKDWPINKGGAESLCYEFNRFLINESNRVGDALYNSKYFCNTNYGFDHYAENWNLFNYNLYGDPSLVLTGISSDNNPPNKPIIVGPISGKIGEYYNFTFSSVDLNGDSIQFYIEWGDGNEWTEFIESGEEITLSHIWEDNNNYIIRAKAKDIFDAESDWTTLEIIIPKNKPYLNQLIFRYFNFLINFL